MKMRDMAMMAMGMMALFVIQKYKEPLKDLAQKAMDKEKSMINNALEDMM